MFNNNFFFLQRKFNVSCKNLIKLKKKNEINFLVLANACFFVFKFMNKIDEVLTLVNKTSPHE
jgi:large-conductance mechanosensitive channel